MVFENTPISDMLKETSEYRFWKFPSACAKHAAKSGKNLQRATNGSKKWGAHSDRLNNQEPLSSIYLKKKKNSWNIKNINDT